MSQTGMKSLFITFEGTKDAQSTQVNCSPTAGRTRHRVRVFARTGWHAIGEEIRHTLSTAR